MLWRLQDCNSSIYTRAVCVYQHRRPCLQLSKVYIALISKSNKFAIWLAPTTENGPFCSTEHPKIFNLKLLASKLYTRLAVATTKARRMYVHQYHSTIVLIAPASCGVSSSTTSRICHLQTILPGLWKCFEGDHFSQSPSHLFTGPRVTRGSSGDLSESRSIYNSYDHDF